MRDDDPDCLTPAQRIVRQFGETTPAGRVFLVVVYTAAFSGITWFVYHFKPKSSPYFHALGSWLRETLGTIGGNAALLAMVAVPLCALWFFVRWLESR
jgi:hypothetical protein